jgi:hypothetical protein
VECQGEPGEAGRSVQRPSGERPEEDGATARPIEGRAPVRNAAERGRSRWSNRGTRGARRWGGRLTAKPDEQAGRPGDRRTMRKMDIRRNDPEPGIRQRLRKRGPLVVIAAVEAVDPLFRNQWDARLRQPKLVTWSSVQPLEGGIVRYPGRAKLRSLNGRNEDRPQDQDREDGSKELGFHDSPHSHAKQRNSYFVSPDLMERQGESCQAIEKWID